MNKAKAIQMGDQRVNSISYSSWIPALACMTLFMASTALAQSQPASQSQPSTAPATTPSIDPPTTGTAVRPDDIIAIIPGPSWTITVDPLTTALGFAHVQVERVVAPGFSIYAGPHAHLFSSVFAQEKEDYLGFGLELGLRKFFKPNAPRGAWGQVRGVLARASSDATGQLESNAAGYVSALVGYTYIHRSGLVLSGGAGVQYLNYQVKEAQQGVEGFFPALHSNIGFSF
jgi:hypothetical protein